MRDTIEELLGQVIGVGWESTAKIFIQYEIDCVAFYSLDKETLKKAGKNFSVALNKSFYKVETSQNYRG